MMLLVVVGLADVINATNVRMRDAACDADLVVEALQHSPVDHRLGKELERHRLAQREIVRAKHLAHAAASERRNDAVALRNQNAGREATFVAGRTRCRPEGETKALSFTHRTKVIADGTVPKNNA